MASRAADVLSPLRTQLQQLLDEIKFQQQKEFQQAALQGRLRIEFPLLVSRY
jgi:hypothetical protein